MKQFLITPAAGKRLIGKSIAEHPEIMKAVKSSTIVIIAGTTNGYVAEELLENIGQAKDFSRRHFYRGISTPPACKIPNENHKTGFPGDVVIVKGIWQKGKTIFDVVDDLREGDIIVKGANAIDPVKKKAAIYIAHPQAGTTGAALMAVIGRRVRLILPAGLEKRIYGDMDNIALKINAPGVQGPRLFPVPGELFTEIDAIYSLTGASSELVAAGGVYGAEGCIWLAVSGQPSQIHAAEELIKSISAEPLF